MLLANGHFAWVTPAVFVIFVNFRGSRSKLPYFVGRMHYQSFRRFRQNHLFSVGDKNTVFQNDRFDNPEEWHRAAPPPPPQQTAPLHPSRVNCQGSRTSSHLSEGAALSEGVAATLASVVLRCAAMLCLSAKFHDLQFTALIFFSLLFREKARKTTKKARIFHLLRTPKILGKGGKNTQKNKEFLEKQKSKEIQKSKEKKIRGFTCFRSENFSHPTFCCRCRRCCRYCRCRCCHCCCRCRCLMNLIQLLRLVLVNLCSVHIERERECVVFSALELLMRSCNFQGQLG